MWRDKANPSPHPLPQLMCGLKDAGWVCLGTHQLLSPSFRTLLPLGDGVGGP